MQVVVLATSILSTQSAVLSLPIQRLRRNTLFVDVLSVKARSILMCSTGMSYMLAGIALAYSVDITLSHTCRTLD